MYGRQTSSILDAALALMDTVGWDPICARASRALEAVPGTAVLAGFSMGAGVIGACGTSGGRPSASFCCAGSRHSGRCLARAAGPGAPGRSRPVRFPPGVDRWQADADRAGVSVEALVLAL
jgi:hypothetical protein